MSCVRLSGFAPVVGVSLLASVLAPHAAEATLVESFTVGSGSHSSFVQFEFANANTYLYEVRYDASNSALRGRDLFTIIAEAQPGFFFYDIVTFSFGEALFGVSIGLDSDAGFGTKPEYLDYWHYWTRDSADVAWNASFVGFGDRVLANGSWDGWVFNSNDAPSVVPVPGMAAVLLLVPITRRRAR